MEFQSYLSQKYQGHESFLENIIFPIFGEDNYESSYDIELLDSEELRGQAARTGIRSIIRCGTIDLDLTPIEVFDITVSDRILMDKNRVGVQAVIHRVMDTYSGAFMIFHYDNDVKWDWRFTFCQMKDKGEFTDNKRYTFLLGPNQSCRTAAQNFQKLADLHENISIKDIVAAFDVEALSKAFFDGYKRHYERFVEFITGKRFVKEGGKFVEKTSHDPHPEYYPAFGSDDKAVRDYTKLLLARIVFLHFLQKKGWLGVPKGGKWGDGDEQFMKHLYERSSEEQKEDFLESVLEPLFFDALNGDRSSSKDVFDTKVVGEVRVPYLNGGLFSKDALDDVVIRYPKEFFGDFLEFLYQYNFTIDENDPNDAQVGIDPEMLGKIFENLLEDNKDKGAFYTPKEIVQYMCQESLIACLETKTGLGEDRLRSFVKDPFVRVSEFTPDEQYAVLGAILNVKICDPAIGSGAFPIGLLNELVRCKEAIYGDEKGRAEIKKEIIRDNIYGVDIEKGAVDIARLRFWLSLIVDEEKPLPLPNLDYKIMQGNSLLEWYDGVDLSHLTDTAVYGDMFGGGRAEDLKRDLSKLLKQYFDESDRKKKNNLKVRITDTIKEILEIAAVVIPEDIDVAENSQFFLWHTWFNEVFSEGGFDICLGNPPYISAPAQVDNPILFAQRNAVIKTKKYASLYQKWDLFVPFMELGFRHLCKPNGIFTMIVPYPLSNQLYAQELRRMMIHEFDTFEIVDLNGTKIFENATVSNCIAFVRNQHSVKQEVVISHIDEKRIIYKSYVQPYSALEQDEKKRLWNLTQEVRETSRHSEMPNLGDICYISVGMVLNADEKTAKGEFEKDDLISMSFDAIHSRKYIEAKDIERYRVKQYRYLEWNTPRCPDKLRRPTFREMYDNPKLMINRLGNLQVYFDKDEKLLHSDSMFSATLWKDLSTVNNKSISTSVKKFCRFTRPEMEKISASFDLRYLIGVLNSSYMEVLLALQRGGDYHIYPEHVRNLPIPSAAAEQQAPIITLVDKILVAKKADQHADTSVWEAEIDRLVYDLYGVPEEERK